MIDNAMIRSLARKMVLAAAVALLVLLAAACVRAEVTPPAVQLQNIVVTLAPESHQISGESTVTLAPGARAVFFRLAQSAKVDHVEVSGKRVPYSFAGGILAVELAASRERAVVTVSYSATFNDPVSRHPAAGEDPTYGVNGAITKEGTFLGDGSSWYPVPELVPARRTISITAPFGTEAVTYGKRVSRESAGSVTRSIWEEVRPVGALALCAGPYRVEERSVRGIDLYTYFYPDNASLSSRYLDAAAKYIAFYSDLFGLFPFDKFAVVENFFPTGYGFPSFTLLGSSVIRLPFIIDTSFPHEIAHSWWGNGIEPDLREGNWSEGLVSYLADYYLKELRSPAEGREYRRQILIDYASLVTPANDFPLAEFQSRVDPASRAIGYGKGAMLFHMIRKRIGDAAFFGALREVCRDHMYRRAGWSDFISAFSRSSGTDQKPFIQQWLASRGAPRLLLAEVASRRQGERWAVSGAVLQPPPLYRVSVPLRLETAGAPVQETVAVSAERSGFVLASDQAPLRLLLDPNADLFRLLSPNEIPLTVNSIKGSTSLIGVITEECGASAETFKRFLASLSQGEAPVIRESQLGQKDAGSHDLVFCGVPRNRALFPEFPHGFQAAKGALAAEQESYPAPDALLFLVLQQPESRKAAALFHPLSETAAAQYAPKITHYGKYSYLLFAGGANRRKGTLGASDAGVAVRFPQ